MKGTLCVTLCVILLACFVPELRAAKSASEIMDSMFPERSAGSQNGYDKRIRPDFGGKPVKVTVSAYVLDVFNIDERLHEFTAQLYFRQRWIDTRLTFEPPPGIRTLNLDSEHAEKMWIPDTFFVNEREGARHDITVDNKFTRVASDGEVLQSIRLTVVGSCKMNLKWFPFDRHICSLQFESYGSTAAEILYEWKTRSTEDPKSWEIGISAGAGGSINKEVRAIKGTAGFLPLTTGNYSRMAIEFLVVRVSTRYLFDVYFPATVLVIIAFITMSVGALQFRVLLSVICMVAIVIFTSLLSMEMPKVSYQTALDFYVFKCSFMVFNVVLVNFILYHLLKSKPTLAAGRIRLRDLENNHDAGGSSGSHHAHGHSDAKEMLESSSEDFNIGRPSFDSRFKELVYKACMYSQFTMPCFFLVFNIIYWMVVLIASSSVGGDDDFMLLENTDN